MAEDAKKRGGTTRTRKTTTNSTTAPAKKTQAKKETEVVKEQTAAAPAPVNEIVTASVPATKTYSEDEVQAMVAKAVQAAMAEMQAHQQAAPQIVQVSADVERVQFLYMAEVADDNVYEVGPSGMYGRIVGKTGTFTVPKSDLSRVMDAMFRLMLERRWIIVVSGLTDEERDAYGVLYKDGEYLSKRAFSHIVEIGDQITELYPNLCAGHREMVAKRYAEAYFSGNRAVKRDIVVELNSISRRLDGGDGAFAPIIESMNQADLKK